MNDSWWWDVRIILKNFAETLAKSQLDPTFRQPVVAFISEGLPLTGKDV